MSLNRTLRVVGGTAVRYLPPRDIEVELRDLQARVTRYEQHRGRWLQAKIRGLRQELAAERASQPVTPADVLAVLERHDPGEILSATTLANELLPRGPSHSAVCRVGLALVSLERDGHVRRIPGDKDHRPNRWVRLSSAEGSGGG